MQSRQNALNQWLLTCINDKPFTLTPLKGDASFRRYFRLHLEGETKIVMDAPPEQESIDAFIHIASTLRTAGTRTPILYATDVKQGFALLEDFGDALLLTDLPPANVAACYKKAMDTLHQMAASPTSTLPCFDIAFMKQEILLFRHWFLENYLNISLSLAHQHLLEELIQQVTQEIMTQPQVFVHRDYHSRNLMRIGESLGVIDFQDAMRGPFTYDLVSLLKDCYVQWPHQQVTEWLAYFYETLPNNQGWSLAAFTRGFNLCGLQRHLKVLGIFSRLYLRDSKPGYLKDLPLTFHYVMAMLEQSQDFPEFTAFMQHVVYPTFMEKHAT